MPRTKARKVPNKRNRNSDDDSLGTQLKEMHRIHEEMESETAMVWQQRKEEIHDLIQQFRGRFSSTVLEMTIGELANGKTNSDSLLTEASGSIASKHDDGYVTESSDRSSKTNKLLAVDEKKSRRRSKSANAMPNTSTMSARNISRSNSTSTTTRASRSKYRTPVNSRLQTMSADRALMNPVTPKIQMNTPVSLLRYPKVGETIISMSGSPVIVNGGSMQGMANINIPIADGMFSMQPNAITNIDSDLVSRIDSSTMNQLKQLQANLAIVMSTMSRFKK